MGKLIRFHAIPGNDYISSFFTKRETYIVEKMISKNCFMGTVKRLGNSWGVSAGT